MHATHYHVGMPKPDLNLLVTLSVLLEEGSVAGAGRRLRLSPSAMSRALARLRRTVGDPLLVRAGRGLVPTPRALALRDRVGSLVDEVRSVLRPAETLDLRQLARTFTLRTSDGFVESFGAPLLARMRREAPLVRLRFVQKGDKESALLREGSVDLETGVIGETTSPELRTRALFRDRFVGVAGMRHPLRRQKITASRYAAASHIVVSRTGADRGLIDEALAPLRLEREVAAIVSGFAAALALARGSDLIATVPERHTASLRTGMFTFALPFETPAITVSMLWHPRMDADPAHRWLRDCVSAAVAIPGSKPASRRS